jgi:hypothetical protein
MRSGITAITCTGDRPKPFGLCTRYVTSQTHRPDQWVIVDDGKTPLGYEGYEAGWLEACCGIEEVKIVRRIPRPDDPAHTLSVNLLVALGHVSNDRVVFIEDDDWYGHRHIETVNDELKSHDLFGFQGIVYYHVGKRCHRTMEGPSLHSSLCQTGMTVAAFPVLKAICSSNDSGVRNTGFIDLRLWREFAGDKKLSKNLGTVVGIKGLPGRVGLTSGWRNSSMDRYTPDPSMKFLESLIGADVGNYGELYERR